MKSYIIKPFNQTNQLDSQPFRHSMFFLNSGNYTVFRKKAPISQMMINLHEIFTRCRWKNANSKYL